MDHYFKGLILALSLCAPSAFAGYAMAVPPAGWSAGLGAGGSFTGTAANAATFGANTVTTNAALNVGGRATTFSATMRFAANAPRFAAAAVMMHPTVRGVAAVAGWLGLAGLVYDATSGLWTVPDPELMPSDGYLWSAGVNNVYITETTPSKACKTIAPLYGAGYSFVSFVGIFGDRADCKIRTPTGDIWTISARRGAPSNCPAGWYSTPAGCVQTAPAKTVTQEEAIEELTRHPMPDDVPQYIPSPLPIEVPEFDPFFVPSGDPVKNPSFDPSSPISPANPPMRQPGSEVRPAPMPNAPWSVTIIPVNRPVTDPNAPPTRVPTPLPSGTGGSGNTPVAETDKGLCDRYPNIIACQTLEDEKDDTKLPTKDIDFSFNPIPGFQGSKSCPAFPSVGSMLGGKQISWQPFCDTLAKISNLLLAFAWASAAFIILGYGRGD